VRRCLTRWLTNGKPSSGTKRQNVKVEQLARRLCIGMHAYHAERERLPWKWWIAAITIMEAIDHGDGQSFDRAILRAMEVFGQGVRAHARAVVTVDMAARRSTGRPTDYKATYCRRVVVLGSRANRAPKSPTRSISPDRPCTYGESPLQGEVEIDESYFGSRRKGKRGRGAAGKVAVFGILKRGGRVYTMMLPNVSRTTLVPS